MAFFEKIFFSLAIGSIFFMSFFQTSFALYGEDLGLDLFEKIDSGIYSLQQKQYEYELTDQGKGNISEVVGSILKQNGFDCTIQSTQQIESLIGNGNENPVEGILNSCGYEGGKAPVSVIEGVQNSLKYVKNTYSERAQQKNDSLYKISRIGLYNDGNVENSSFDLIYDLQEIDKIIFGEELEYKGKNNPVTSKSIQDYIDRVINTPLEDLVLGGTGSGTATGTTNPTTATGSDDVGDDVYHDFVCVDNESGLDDDTLDDLVNDLEGTGSTVPVNVWVYPEGGDEDIYDWEGPEDWGIPFDTYDPVKDEWGCDPSSFFCIIITFESSNYGLAGGETRSIKKILEKSLKNLDKPANASLTQRKMTTNNFEIGAMIKNLPGMLRGFGLEVQSVPIPNLDITEEVDTKKTMGKSKAEIYFEEAYTALGIEYKHRNNINNIKRYTQGATMEEEQKVSQSAQYMPNEYLEQRLNLLGRFHQAEKDALHRLEKQTDAEIKYEDMKKFAKQFGELERFTESMYDFSKVLGGEVKRLNSIPTDK